MPPVNSPDERPAQETKTTKDFVEDVKRSADMANTEPIPQLTRTVGKFAMLVGKLAEDSEKTSQDNLLIQRRLTTFTRVILALTIAMFLLQSVQVLFQLCLAHHSPTRQQSAEGIPAGKPPEWNEPEIDVQQRQPEQSKKAFEEPHLGLAPSR